AERGGERRGDADAQDLAQGPDRRRPEARPHRARAPEHEARTGKDGDQLARERSDRGTDEPEAGGEHGDRGRDHLEDERHARPDGGESHVALAAQHAVEHAAGERDRGPAEEDAGEQRGRVEDLTARSHPAERGGRPQEDDGAEREPGCHAEDERLPCQDTRGELPSRAERPCDGRRRPGAAAPPPPGGCGRRERGNTGDAAAIAGAASRLTYHVESAFDAAATSITTVVGAASGAMARTGEIARRPSAPAR